MSETTLVVQLPKELEKQLRAHYDEMISNAVARVFEDKELYNLWFVCQVCLGG